MILEIEKALNCLNKGGILIYPSDTIWAIGCDELIKKQLI